MVQTSSPRDDRADANLDLARKRARLSEEPDSSESVAIEALVPDFVDSHHRDAVIRIGTDEAMDTPGVSPDGVTMDLLGELRQELAENYYLDVDRLHCLSRW
jgi:hypothetical protein